MSSYPAVKENFMNEYFKEFSTEFSPQIEVTSFPPSYLKNNETGIPDALLIFWSEAGASGYAEGVLWSTSPVRRGMGRVRAYDYGATLF
jgi:hypothetical protein